MLDRVEATRILEAPKDAGGANAAWNETTLDGIPLRKTLQVAVQVDPPPAERPSRAATCGHPDALEALRLGGGGADVVQQQTGLSAV